MPIVRVELLEGRSAAQKRKLAAAITDVVVEHAAVRADQVRVVFTDHDPGDWAIGGELVSDRRARVAVKWCSSSRPTGSLNLASPSLAIESTPDWIGAITESDAPPARDVRRFEMF